jgi:hypothetical protein
MVLAQGRELPGTLVVLRSTDPAGVPPVLRTTTAGRDGLYHFDHVPAGVYSVAVSPGSGGGHRRNNVSVPARGMVSIHLWPTGGVTCECNFDLTTVPSWLDGFPFVSSQMFMATAVTGRVIDQNGVALPFASIEYDTYRGYSDLNGDYRVVLPIGRHRFTFRFPGHQSTTRDVDARPGLRSIGDTALELNTALNATASAPDDAPRNEDCRCGRLYGFDYIDSDGYVRRYQ